ncbi:unnamed protein product [Anisakis simplex]|uniref:SERPIN domain-containing protein n=1 Tax=Anisakis simplex TaxID=6269 RepID=A0A0M3JEY2_ANISI|nr:unnamed protein product [Anisakis simplex]
MWFIFLGVLLIASVYGGTISSKDYIPNVQADFALKLLTRLDETRSPIVLSPISISIALAMAYAGAEGNTKAQLGNVIARDRQKVVTARKRSLTLNEVLNTMKRVTVLAIR